MNQDICDVKESESECVYGSLTQAMLDDLKSTHGERIHAMEYEEIGTVAWKPPSVGVWRQFTDDLFANQRPRSEILLDLVRGTVVYPNQKQFQQLLRQWPTLLNQLGRQIQDTASIKQKKPPVLL